MMKNPCKMASLEVIQIRSLFYSIMIWLSNENTLDLRGSAGLFHDTKVWTLNRFLVYKEKDKQILAFEFSNS